MPKACSRAFPVKPFMSAKVFASLDHVWEDWATCDVWGGCLGNEWRLLLFERCLIMLAFSYRCFDLLCICGWCWFVWSLFSEARALCSACVWICLGKAIEHPLKGLCRHTKAHIQTCNTCTTNTNSLHFTFPHPWEKGSWTAQVARLAVEPHLRLPDGELELAFGPANTPELAFGPANSMKTQPPRPQDPKTSADLKPKIWAVIWP